MALRDQPYLPLYIQDVLTDEKLIECSAEAHGVYFRLLCILHKQETYGLICLKQKYKQTDKQVLNFAQMLCKQMPFETKQIQNALEELITEGVLILEGDNLYQKRMLRDGELSTLRAEVGKKGGSSVTKQYGVKGYLYLMSDGFDKNKIGISLNPKNRLYRLRCDLKLPKHFAIKDTIQVKDMGLSEDIAHEFFSDILDGEWLKSDYNKVQEKFALLKAKLQANNQAKSQANTEYESEYVNDSVFVSKEGVQREETEIEEYEFYPFEEFWNDYDKKVGEKEKLSRKWEKISVKDRKAIKEYLPKYKTHQPDKKFRKNPETFLNNKGWNDELISALPVVRGQIKPQKGVSIADTQKIYEELTGNYGHR